MSTEWIVIETITIFVENFAIVYILNSRFSSKTKAVVPQYLFWFCLTVWGLSATFLSLPFYDIFSIVIVITYLCLFKKGKLIYKVFGTFLLAALTLSVSLLGISLVSFIVNARVEDALLYQDTSRLLAIILVKMMQVVIFYALAKKHNRVRAIKKKPMLALYGAVFIVFSCLLLIFFNMQDIGLQSSGLITGIAICLLFILIGIFLIYELFVREEVRNIDLSAQLQHLELESRYFKELNAVHTDLCTWRHEYKNNLIALRALIENKTPKKALEYLDGISIESERERAMLQTGNPVLDAVVSSKLWLASSRGIEVSIHAVHPENSHIKDNDLCAIAGNLLDNAIEACERIEESAQTRFISFSLLLKGKNLTLSISNSFNGKIKRNGERYLTVKDKKFHGIGIKYVDSIVNKYQGHVLREYKDNIFETHIILPLIPAEGETKK